MTALHVTPIDYPPIPESPGTWFQVTGLPTRAGRDIQVHFRAHWTDTLNGQQIEITDVVISGSTIHSEDLRTIALGAIERKLRTNPTLSCAEDEGYMSPPEPLTRKRHDETTSDFGRRVAETYHYYAERTAKPSVAISNRTGIPVATVRRWIAEARASGAIPPGSRGRAG